MNQSISRRISYLNIFFTICIVCYHCGSPAIGSSRLNLLLNDIFDGFCAVAMSYFFTVTGFLLFNNLSSRTYARKIKSRIKTLLMPYLCWEILFTIVLTAAGVASYSPQRWIRTVFLFDMWPPDGALWYVYAVFIMALPSLVLLSFLKKRSVAFKSILILYPVLYLVHLRYFTGEAGELAYGYFGNIISYIPSYLTGAFFGSLNHEESQHYLKKLLLPIALMSVVGFDRPNIFGWCATRLIPLLLLYGAPLFRQKVDGPLPLQNLTFLMYAIHLPFQFLFKTQLSAFAEIASFHPAAYNLFYRLLTIVSVIIISKIIHFLMSKVCPPALRLLTGGR